MFVMCRFLAYKGTPILMDQLLYQPKNSLIHQSYHALERDDPVNGDGFGIGWYVPEISPEPVRYLSTKPAWNDRNLRALAPKTRAGCFFAHVRDANIGGVTELNCHPFQYHNLLMMHNGHIEQFGNLKRPIRRILRQNIYNWLSGETDTEHFFALFLHFLYPKKTENFLTEDYQEALFAAIRHLHALNAEIQPGCHYYLNLAITDGRIVLACRYDSNPEIESPTLYYSSGGYFDCSDGICRMHPPKNNEHAVLITSEKLTAARKDWHLIPELHMMTVSEKLEVTVVEMQI